MRISTIIAILFAASAMPAIAATVDDGVPTRHVSYRDLDLATPKGVAALERRIRLATVAVCTPVAQEPGGMYLDEAKFRACRDGSLERVRPQMLAAIAHNSGVAGIDQAIVLAAR